MATDRQSGRFSGPALKRYTASVGGNENFVLLVILVAIMGVVAALTGGTAFTALNVKNIFLSSSIIGIVAIGQAFVIITGGIDLSVGGLAIMIACFGASLMTSNASLALLPWPVPLAAGLILMLAMGMGVGALNGALISRLRIPALILTLAVWQITKGMSYQFTKQGETIRWLPEGLAFIGQGSVLGIPMPIIILIVMAALAFVVLRYTPFGRSVYAVGGDANAAWLSGIKVTRVRFIVFIISGFCAAVGSVIVLSRVMGANTAILSGLEMDTIAAVVIGGVSLAGGKGSIIGAMIGVLILGVISNGMNLLGLGTYDQMMVKGGIIVVAAAVDAWRRTRRSLD